MPGPRARKERIVELRAYITNSVQYIILVKVAGALTHDAFGGNQAGHSGQGQGSGGALITTACPRLSSNGHRAEQGQRSKGGIYRPAQ